MGKSYANDKLWKYYDERLYKLKFHKDIICYEEQKLTTNENKRRSVNDPKTIRCSIDMSCDDIFGISQFRL